jgi:hypothetical protein
LHLPCEGFENNAHNSDTPNLVNYTDVGGRIFTTHFGYQWLATTLSNVARNNSAFYGTANWYIDKSGYNDPLTGNVDREHRGRAGHRPDRSFTQVRVAFEGGALASDPVLSGDKRSFFFVITLPGHKAIVYESVWDSLRRSWGLPASLPNDELQPTADGKCRRPTGTSSDDLTLFFFDDATNTRTRRLAQCA